MTTPHHSRFPDQSGGPPGSAMADELAEGPAVIRRILEGVPAWRDSVRRLAVPPPRGVAVTARGSSDHASAYGRYLLEQALGVPTWSTAPSLVTRFHSHVDMRGVMAISVSQSGRTPEVVMATRCYGESGAATLAITNDPDGDLAGVAQLTIPLQAGYEVAVPATKTFTATLAVFAALGDVLSDDGRFRVDADAVAQAASEAVADAGAVDAAVEELAAEDVIVHLGRGYLLPLATEAALKITETCATANLCWSTVDFRHGPYALSRRPGLAAVVHHTVGAVSGDAASIVADLVSAGARVVTVGDPLPGGIAHVAVPGHLPEHVQPLVHAIRVQQLALGLAQARHADPDHPAGLHKVTATS